jgi:hypothetical protein
MNTKLNSTGLTKLGIKWNRCQCASFSYLKSKHHCEASTTNSTVPSDLGRFEFSMVQRFHAAQSNKCPEFGPPEPAWEVVGKEIFSKKMSNLGK